MPNPETHFNAQRSQNLPKKLPKKPINIQHLLDSLVRVEQVLRVGLGAVQPAVLHQHLAEHGVALVVLVHYVQLASRDTTLVLRCRVKFNVVVIW